MCYSIACLPHHAFHAPCSQASVQVIEQFGKYKRMAYPGFSCVCCCIGEAVAGGLSTRVQQLDVRCETKTADNVFVDISVTVQYNILRENMYDGKRQRRAGGVLQARRPHSALLCSASTSTPPPALFYPPRTEPPPPPRATAFYKLTDPRSQITAYVFDEVRASVPKINLDDVFTSKEEIAQNVKEELTKSMQGFGFQIIR